jgi:putative transcriptional regulator
MDTLPQTEMSDSALEHIWKSIEEDLPLGRQEPRHITVNGLPAVLAPFFPGGLRAVKWRTLVPGIQHHRLIDVESGSGGIRLLRIAQGVEIPDHTHLGSELTLILQGSYSDELGKFERGDLSDVDSSVQHRPVVDSEQPCICLVATDERLVFRSTLNRMIQPLIGI